MDQRISYGWYIGPGWLTFELGGAILDTSITKAMAKLAQKYPIYSKFPQKSQIFWIISLNPHSNFPISPVCNLIQQEKRHSDLSPTKAQTTEKSKLFLTKKVEKLLLGRTAGERLCPVCRRRSGALPSSPRKVSKGAHHRRRRRSSGHVWRAPPPSAVGDESKNSNEIENRKVSKGAHLCLCLFVLPLYHVCGWSRWPF